MRETSQDRENATAQDEARLLLRALTGEVDVRDLSLGHAGQKPRKTGFFASKRAARS